MSDDHNHLPPMPEPSELDGARWGYTADDMAGYAEDAYAAGAADAAVLRRERDELAARKASVEQAELIDVPSLVNALTLLGISSPESQESAGACVGELVSELIRGVLRLKRNHSAAAPDRAADLDADIIEAQRAVVQQLASRPACDWPGKCKHQRQAPVAALERTEPAGGCSDSVACPKGGAR